MTKRAVPVDPPESLLDLIYDAATDEALWTEALIRIAAMTHSVGGYVFGARSMSISPHSPSTVA